MDRAPRRVLVALSSIACAISCTGCGTLASRAALAGARRAVPGSRLDAPYEEAHRRRAPDFTLTDSLGHEVSLADYRGRAVLLTFVYDHCHDVCPLMVGKLHAALQMLGANARRAQVIAVSVDPRGDTRSSVRRFLASHGMTGRMEYLIGSRSQLSPVWKEYGIRVQASPSSREVSHSALVYGITASGFIRALYPASFKPRWIAHDVPVLASE